MRLVPYGGPHPTNLRGTSVPYPTATRVGDARVIFVGQPTHCLDGSSLESRRQATVGLLKNRKGCTVCWRIHHAFQLHHNRGYRVFSKPCCFRHTAKCVVAAIYST